MATETRTITVCDKCCELLEHNTSSEGELIEIRVEPCPECSRPGLKFSDSQLDLLRRIVQHTNESMDFSFGLSNYEDLYDIELKIREQYPEDHSSKEN